MLKSIPCSSHPTLAAARIAGLYCLLALVWITLSDHLLTAVVEHSAVVAWIQVNKKWFFVAMTTLALFLLLGKEMARYEQKEDSLKRSEERYRSLIALAVDGIMLGSHDGCIIEANDQICDMFGMARDTMIHMHIRELPFTKQSIEQTPFRFDLLNQGRTVVSERDLVRPDGTEITVEMRTKMMPDGSYQSICRDITLQKKKEADLERLRIAIEQAAEVIVITDQQGSIQYANPAFERITGYTAREVLGQNPRVLNSGQQDAHFYREMWQTISQGRSWTGRFINRKKNGALFTEEATISPVFDAHGLIVNYVAVKKDITGQLRLEAQLVQAQKMEAIGTLAGGIAHDFNNILGAIIGYAEMALDTSRPDSVAARDLEKVLEASQRATGLVQQILAFSRQKATNRIALEPGALVKEVIQLLRPTLPSTIAIDLQVADRLHALQADPAQLHQILMNLCTNAYHAMESTGGVLRIEAHNRRIAEADASLSANLQPGRYVEISVADTGCGIPVEIRDRIFDPYFTTKEIGKGTGLGLAIVHSVVASYGGAIRCLSEPGSGTTFQVLLPALERDAASPAGAPAPAPLGKERILFVDDEIMLANLGKTMLERLGYAVTVHTGSEAALAEFAEQPQRFDLVITDQTMPGLTGMELTRKMLALRPDLPVILCTGYSTILSEEAALAGGVRGFIYKPLTKGALAQHIRQVLDRPGPPR